MELVDEGMYAIERPYPDPGNLDVEAERPGPIPQSEKLSPHPIYSPSSLSWFDVRVVYVKVSGCPQEASPDTLHCRFPSRASSTSVELNGAVVPPQEEIVLALRRDRVDCNAEEATYVSTDNIRSSGSLKFEVAASTEGELIVCGVLERSEAPLKGFGGYGVPLKTEWNLELSCAVSSIGCCFIKADPLDFDTPPSQPIVEVCLVGKFEAAPVCLEQTVKLVARKRSLRRTSLDAIPEDDEAARFYQEVHGDFYEKEDRELSPYNKQQHSYYERLRLDDFGDGEDGELTWFTAGVRVGVGLGLGLMLGVGIGVGLMVKTYHTTTRTLKRGLF